jgi:hypothetical protein
MTSEVPRVVADPNLEAVFHVPPRHRLVEVRSRSRGEPESATFWDHEEYDASSKLIACFENFEKMGLTGLKTSGWRRYDCTGRLVGAGELEPHPTVTVRAHSSSPGESWAKGLEPG